MKKFENGLSVGAIIMAVLGIILLIFPTLTNKVIVMGIGTALIVYGIYRVIRYLRREATVAVTQQDIFVGLISVVTGIFMLTYSKVVISILPFLFGLILIFGGAMSVQSAFDMKSFGSLRWSYNLFVGIAFAVVGVIALKDPFASAALLTRFVGAGLLIEGIYMAAAGVTIEKLRKDFMGDDPEFIEYVTENKPELFGNTEKRIMFWKKKQEQEQEKTPEEIEQEIAELDRLLKYLEEHPEIEEAYDRECRKAADAFPPYIVL